MATGINTTTGETMPGAPIGPRVRAELERRVRELETEIQALPTRHAGTGAVAGVSKSHTRAGATSMSNAIRHMARARNRFKEARDAVGEVPMSDDIGELAIEMLHILDGVISLLDKRIKAAKEQGK